MGFGLGTVLRRARRTTKSSENFPSSKWNLNQQPSACLSPEVKSFKIVLAPPPPPVILRTRSLSHYVSCSVRNLYFLKKSSLQPLVSLATGKITLYNREFQKIVSFIVKGNDTRRGNLIIECHLLRQKSIKSTFSS